jgi:5-methylcytosine-specific restriction protein A
VSVVEPLRICPHPGCRTLVRGGRCERHQKQQHEGTSKNRSGDPFYSSKAWKDLRLAFLREHPLCECDECKRAGAVVAADVVDHIKPRCDHPELSLEWTNLRSMAAAHHNRHTARTRAR